MSKNWLIYRLNCSVLLRPKFNNLTPEIWIHPKSGHWSGNQIPTVIRPETALPVNTLPLVDGSVIFALILNMVLMCWPMWMSARRDNFWASRPSDWNKTSFLFLPNLNQVFFCSRIMLKWLLWFWFYCKGLAEKIHRNSQKKFFS